MKKIYIVMKSVGEYSDHRAYEIAAYESKEEASSHEWALTLEQRRISNLIRAKKIDIYDVNNMCVKEKLLFINQIDPPKDINNYVFDYDSLVTDFYVVETTIWDSFKDFKSASNIKK
jgi:hypothetical protein